MRERVITDQQREAMRIAREAKGDARSSSVIKIGEEFSIFDDGGHNIVIEKKGIQHYYPDWEWAFKAALMFAIRDNMSRRTTQSMESAIRAIKDATNTITDRMPK